jgi:hypothetical protein
MAKPGQDVLKKLIPDSFPSMVLADCSHVWMPDAPKAQQFASVSAWYVQTGKDSPTLAVMSFTHGGLAVPRVVSLNALLLPESEGLNGMADAIKCGFYSDSVAAQMGAACALLLRESKQSRRVLLPYERD